MKLYRKIDKDGLFVEDVLFDSIPSDENGEPDPSYIAEPVPSGFYWPKWNGSEWIEGGTAPDPQPYIPTETEKLQAQVKAASEYVDFLEEVIVEMAQVVYK